MKSGGMAPPFLTSKLGGSDWSASRLHRLTPEEIAPGTHWIGWLVGPKAGLDVVKKKKICPCWESNPAVQSLISRYTDWAIPTPE
jgi:hypothetical protein